MLNLVKTWQMQCRVTFLNSLSTVKIWACRGSGYFLRFLGSVNSFVLIYLSLLLLISLSLEYIKNIAKSNKLINSNDKLINSNNISSINL